MDQGSIVAAVVAGAIAGAAAGFGVGVAKGKPAEARPTSGGSVAALSEQVHDLATELASVQAEVARLRRQRAALPAAAAPSGQPEAAHHIDDPAFDAAVRDAVDRMEQERASQRDERRREAIQRWADRLAERAQLNDAQKAKALAIANDLNDKQRDLRSPDAGSLTGRELGERREALRDQAEKALAEVLSRGQMDIYREAPDLRIDALGRGGRGRPN